MKNLKQKLALDMVEVKGVWITKEEQASEVIADINRLNAELDKKKVNKYS